MPLPVVCALIQQEGRVLIARRPPGRHLAGKWEFPGGKIEPGETAEQALVREIHEELGCKVERLLPGPPVLHSYEWGEIRLHPFICEIQEGSPPAQAHEHEEIAWLTLQELPSADLAPADQPVLAWFMQSASP